MSELSQTEKKLVDDIDILIRESDFSPTQGFHATRDQILRGELREGNSNFAQLRQELDRLLAKLKSAKQKPSNIVAPAVPISTREVLAYQTVIEKARQVVADYKIGSDRCMKELDAAIKNYDQVVNEVMEKPHDD